MEGLLKMYLDATKATVMFISKNGYFVNYNQGMLYR